MSSNATETNVTATATAPERATWKQHGNPVKGFEFYGTAVKAADAKSYKVSKAEVVDGQIVIKNGGGREVARFGPATKFWAVVPADAPRLETTVSEPKVNAEPLAPIEITAPKGGDKMVSVIPGAFAMQVEASGLTISAIARAHGQNPSQLRRLAADDVKRVDLVRAQSIADAMGVPLSALFGEAEDKAAVAAEAARVAKAAAKEAEAKAAAAAEAKAAKAAEAAEAKAAAKAAAGK